MREDEQLGTNRKNHSKNDHQKTISNLIRLRNLGFEIASQDEVFDLFPIAPFLKKVWWSHIDEVK